MAGSSGSATGNPRNKVALKPGHSLMDWIRLGKSGVDLSGTGGVLLQVTNEQLAQHKSVDDAWICIRGKVYNITSYLEYHPGGVKEILRGAGIDATSLFNQVHSWVNFESILQKCLVGHIVSSVDGDIFATPDKSSSKKYPKSQENLPSDSSVTKLDWSQQRKFVTFYFYMKEPLGQLYVTNIPENELWALVNGTWLGWSLQAPISWPPDPSLPTNDMKKVELKVDKAAEHGGPKMWQQIPKMLPIQKKTFPTGFSQISIVSISQVNYNVHTITVAYSSKIYYYIPLGHHVVLKGTIEGRVVERHYTPISNLIGQPSFPSGITLMLKSYPDGVFSSWFTSRQVGDILNISGPVGGFSVQLIGDRTNLILIAAGTGFTPMVRIINWALQANKKFRVKLLFFNRTEKDIIWKRELSHLMSKNSRFSVEHILSQPDSSWKGKRGWITLQLIQSVLPEFTKEVPIPYYVFTCGPNAFTQITERYLQDMNYTTDNYHCFRG